MDLDRLRNTRLGDPEASPLDDGRRANSVLQGGAVVGRGATSFSKEESCDGAREARFASGVSGLAYWRRLRARCLAICALFIANQDSMREQLMEQ